MENEIKIRAASVSNKSANSNYLPKRQKFLQYVHPANVYDRKQGCQMAHFQTKNPNYGKIWRALYWKILSTFYGHLEYNSNFIYFMAIWSFSGNLLSFPQFWYILSIKIWQP
jgi:hypothetical protein